MKKAISGSFYLPLVFLFLLATGCDQGQSRLFVLTGTTMGTTYTIKIVQDRPPLRQVEKETISTGIHSLLQEVNRQMSTYLPDSEISSFNNYQGNKWFPISSDFSWVMKSALSISIASNGAFDVTVGSLVNLWGFGTEERETVIPDETEIQRRKRLTGYQNISISTEPPAIRKNNPNISCDLSAIAKGFGVDKVARFLEEAEIQHYMVEIGGEVRTKGLNSAGKKWHIGLQSPEEKKIAKVVNLSNLAMATSGDYANYHEVNGKRYSHTIDPRTARPIEHHLASVTVIHPSCMKADGLATAINVLGPVAGYEFAVKQKLPVFMLIRKKGAFVEKMSPEFKQFLGSQSQ